MERGGWRKESKGVYGRINVMTELLQDLHHQCIDAFFDEGELPGESVG